MSFPLLISLIALIVSFCSIAMAALLFKRFNNQLDTNKSQDKSLSELMKANSSLSEELHEIRSGNYGVSRRVKALIEQVESLQTAQQNLVEQDPQSRFYSKGAKLISQGASLEEVMRECDMPAAEAELLFNLHNNQR
ncbi:DUF2802 domain-containing protein [uncultured Paraglaciecola sp.]|uniref:DUF2802 domain-containing protein n=1 Tax=uncultured Paraglaciecola sp. TaxID=1765024 RepID=UPI002618141A|nr:DUF2802 domain-containing protein [uncultured Paraglaciecola sp.]